VIIGSGLIAKAFAPHLKNLHDTCIYAAGVSNSSCKDEQEFRRDRQRLDAALASTDPSTLIIYFSTCSVDDPWSRDNPYPTHKRRLEDVVRERQKHLIIRLPQVAGKTPNPHTLLNYLYSRIARSERFDLWRNSGRNIIDIDDVVSLILHLVVNEHVSAETINIANPRNYSLMEIVSAMETVTRHQAIYNTLDKGGQYAIDINRIAVAIRQCAIHFDDGYLLRTLHKYYT